MRSGSTECKLPLWVQIGLSLHSAIKECLSSGASFPESLDGVEMEGIRNLRGETPEVRLQVMFDSATRATQNIYLAPRETPGSRIYPGGYRAGQLDFVLTTDNMYPYKHKGHLLNKKLLYDLTFSIK